MLFEPNQCHVILLNIFHDNVLDIGHFIILHPLLHNNSITISTTVHLSVCYQMNSKSSEVSVCNEVDSRICEGRNEGGGYSCSQLHTVCPVLSVLNEVDEVWYNRSKKYTGHYHHDGYSRPIHVGVSTFKCGVYE